MRNLISEGNEMMTDAEDEATRDALIIAAAQKVEHYEIASYGTTRTWAFLLGKPEIADLLQSILDEEKTADQKLTRIAESHVNIEAAEGEETEGAGRQRSMAGRASTARGSRPHAADRDRMNRSNKRGAKRSRRSR